jgi:predicted amidophosphoribosyltransferase
MAPVRSLTALYEDFLLTPRGGPGVCSRCFNLTGGYDQCFSCTRQEPVLDALVPISYSVAHEQLHAALAGYKRVDGVGARLLGIELAAVLWRFLAGHERCLARAAGSDGFEIVTTVPSSDPVRDEAHPLRWIVGELVASTRSRHERLLTRSRAEAPSREFSPSRYLTARSLLGEDVLLIDDTWTTGASAQSAAAALRAAGCGAVGAVVIGRHVNREWGNNDERLRGLPDFHWGQCALCHTAAEPPPARLTETTAA